MTPHRAVYRSPPPQHLVLILALAGGAWVFLTLGLWLFGLGTLTLLDVIGGVLP